MPTLSSLSLAGTHSVDSGSCGEEVLVYVSCLVLQLQRYVERIDLVSGNAGTKGTGGATLGF